MSEAEVRITFRYPINLDAYPNGVTTAEHAVEFDRGEIEDDPHAWLDFSEDGHGGFKDLTVRVGVVNEDAPRTVDVTVQVLRDGTMIPKFDPEPRDQDKVLMTVGMFRALIDRLNSGNGCDHKNKLRPFRAFDGPYYLKCVECGHSFGTVHV